MARINKLYEKDRVTSIAQDDLLTIGQYQSDGSYKVKTIERDDAIASLNAAVVVTYAELTALVTASSLLPMMWYKITNAVSGTLVLAVQSIAVNKISDLAINTANGDMYAYDITTDTNVGVINIFGSAPTSYINSKIRFRVTQDLTSIDTHAFEDYSIISSPTPTGQGYCSFDSKPTWNGTGDHSHYVGYQSRPIYDGDGDLVDYLYGFRSFPSHVGTGRISRYVGVQIDDIAGTGPLDECIGLNIDLQTRGSGNNLALQTNGNIRFQNLGDSIGDVDNFVTVNSLGYVGRRATAGVLEDLLNTTTVSPSVATPSTNKIQVTINGTTYYLLATT